MLISTVILLLGIVASVNSVSIHTKNKAYNAQVAELKAQIKEEETKTDEIERLKEYMGTDKYVEDVAKDRLGLVYENEIIFKPAK